MLSQRRESFVDVVMRVSNTVMMSLKVSKVAPVGSRDYRRIGIITMISASVVLFRTPM